MRYLFALVFLALGGIGAAQAYDDPKALLDAIYAPYIAGKAPARPENYYSASLKELLAKNLARQAVDTKGQPVDPDAAPTLSFDPFIEGQHSLLLDVAITAPVLQGDHAAAIVSFHNFDHASLLSIAMVKEADGWKVEDVASLGSDQNWLLSWLLQYDPFGAM